MTATTPTSATATASDVDAVRAALVPAGIVVAAVTVVFELFRADSKGESFTMIGVSVVATALVFGLLLPRRLRGGPSPKVALGLAIPALLLAPVAFWSGLPLVLGAGGALLGLAGRKAPSRSGMCIAALVVGAIAVIGYLGIYVGDWIAHPSDGWL